MTPKPLRLACTAMFFSLATLPLTNLSAETPTASAAVTATTANAQVTNPASTSTQTTNPQGTNPQSAGTQTTAASAAHSLVEQVTRDVIGVINTHKSLLKDDPASFYAKVTRVLDPVVEYGFISKQVMAEHFAKATPAQREAFANTFKNSMVETFAKGLATYSDLSFALRAAEPVADTTRKIDVVQDVTTPDGKHVLSYTMAKTKAGEWKLINVVFNGVNLGANFKKQFAQAAAQHQGNLDTVIANWGKPGA